MIYPNGRRVLCCRRDPRAYQPGCKLDEMLILVGDQGLGKSRLNPVFTA